MLLSTKRWRAEFRLCEINRLLDELWLGLLDSSFDGKIQEAQEILDGLYHELLSARYRSAVCECRKCRRLPTRRRARK